MLRRETREKVSCHRQQRGCAAQVIGFVKIIESGSS